VALVSTRFDGVSSFKCVSSNVPQECVFGPLLILIYINDIADLFSGVVNIELVADNIKIYWEISDVSALRSFQKISMILPLGLRCGSLG